MEIIEVWHSYIKFKRNTESKCKKILLVLLREDPEKNGVPL